MPQDTKNTTFCPHWSGNDQRCAMHDDGLFIPLETYVENYCTTSRHEGCRHLQPSGCTNRDESLTGKIKVLHEALVGCKH